MDDTSDKNMPKMAAREISAGLLQKLLQRAGSLDFSLNRYLSNLHDSDSILQIDRGIAAIFMAWAPLWLLMVALAFSPQGKDLLAQLSSDSISAVKFIGMLIILCAVATFGATALIAAWLYPRLGFQRPYLYRPIIPDTARKLDNLESDDVLRAARAPIVVAIGMPIALLATASFTPLAWKPGSIILFVFAVLFFSFIVWKISRLAVKYVLHLTAWSYIALLFGVACLTSVGVGPAFFNFYLRIEILSVGVAILWLVVFFGFSFAIYASRHDTLSANSPSFLGQHFKLTLIVIILVAIHFARVWFWPGEPSWMTVAPTLLSSEHETPSMPDTERLTSNAAMDLFKASHSTETRPPLVLVTAAGGGIRAAYWSARVLSKLQDGQKDFANHVFAISAVSGGALGTSVFKALSTMETTECPDSETYTTCSSRFLAGDFIGANIAAVASGGVFSFVTSGFLSSMMVPRDQALEDGWMLQWSDIVPKGPRFDGPFDDLFKSAGLPALLLNGTSAKSGNRVITSNLDVSTLKPPKPQQSAKTKDSTASDGSEQSKPGCIVDRGIVNPAQYLRLPVTSAILTSARFPYITPPGLLRLPPSSPKPDEARTSCRDWEEIVDGGFIDNEGIVTMREVLAKLLDLNGGAAKFTKAYRLIVIRLSAEASPVIASHEKNTPPDRDNLDQIYSTAMSQLAAAGQSLVQDFREQIEEMGGTWVEFNAIDDDAPLGWTLSSSSRRRLDAWLDGPASPQWAEVNRELEVNDRDILKKFAEKVDMPSRIQSVLSQFQAAH